MKGDRRYPNHALNSAISAHLGLSSLQGVSLASSSAPKSPRNFIGLRSKNFQRGNFMLMQGKSAGNPGGLPSILTRQKRKLTIENRGSDNFCHPKIYQGAKRAAEYAEPYLEQAREMANGAVVLAKKGIKLGQKKIKRKMFIVKLKNAVEITANIVLIVATVVAAISALLTFINKINDN